MESGCSSDIVYSPPSPEHNAHTRVAKVFSVTDKASKLYLSLFPDFITLSQYEEFTREFHSFQYKMYHQILRAHKLASEKSKDPRVADIMTISTQFCKLKFQTEELEETEKLEETEVGIELPRDPSIRGNYLNSIINTAFSRFSRLEDAIKADYNRQRQIGDSFPEMNLQNPVDLLLRAKELARGDLQSMVKHLDSLKQDNAKKGPLEKLESDQQFNNDGKNEKGKAEVNKEEEIAEETEEEDVEEIEENNEGFEIRDEARQCIKIPIEKFNLLKLEDIAREEKPNPETLVYWNAILKETENEVKINALQDWYSIRFLEGNSDNPEENFSPFGDNHNGRDHEEFQKTGESYSNERSGNTSFAGTVNIGGNYIGTLLDNHITRITTSGGDYIAKVINIITYKTIRGSRGQSRRPKRNVAHPRHGIPAGVTPEVFSTESWVEEGPEEVKSVAAHLAGLKLKLLLDTMKSMREAENIARDNQKALEAACGMSDHDSEAQLKQDLCKEVKKLGIKYLEDAHNEFINKRREPSDVELRNQINNTEKKIKEMQNALIKLRQCARGF